MFSCNCSFQSQLCAGSFDKRLWTMRRCWGRSRAIGYFLRLTCLRAGSFFSATMDTLRATFQIPLKDSFYSLIIKKPITKYCTLAIVCLILFFIFSKYTCIHLHICYNDKLFNIQVGPRGAGYPPGGW